MAFLPDLYAYSGSVQCLRTIGAHLPLRILDGLNEIRKEQKRMITNQECLPSLLLQDYVRFYQYSETRLGNATLFKPLPARPEQFLQFSLREPYTVIDRVSGASSKAPPIVVVGRQTQRNIDLMATGDIFTFTIHFQPAGFYRLFHVPLLELTNMALDAADVVGYRIHILHELLHHASSLQTMVCLAETFLLLQVFDQGKRISNARLSSHGSIHFIH